MTAPVLVTGAGGQLGRALVRRLGAAAVALDHAEVPVEDAAAIARALDRHMPGAVINAAAYTAVDRAETEPEAAFAANRDGPAALARACAARGVRLVHVSTDYVFDGARPSYAEDDPTGPLNVYGQSKLAGEIAVLEAAPGALVVRTSWLFSADGKNFATTMLALARTRPVLRVVADQHGCPTWAGDLARALVALAARPEVTGRLHYCGDPPTTWHGFATAIVEEAGLAGRVRVEPIGSADYPTPARRPASSVLATGRARALGLAPAPWRDGLRAVVAASGPGRP